MKKYPSVFILLTVAVRHMKYHCNHSIFFFVCQNQMCISLGPVNIVSKTNYSSVFIFLLIVFFRGYLQLDLLQAADLLAVVVHHALQALALIF